VGLYKYANSDGGEERMRSKIMKSAILVRIGILAIILVLVSSNWTSLAAGLTNDRDTAVGQVLLLENNRVWPTGIPYIYSEPCNLLSGYPDPNWVPHEWRAEYFRKSLHRLINRTELEELYVYVMTRAECWLPEGVPGLWNKPSLRLPTYDPMLAVELLDAAGFVQGTKPNPDYDASLPWSAQYIRIDPISGLPLNEMTYTYYPACGDPITITGIEYYAIAPEESPLGYERDSMITEWWRQAGIPVELVTGTYVGKITMLINPVLEDYQIMAYSGILWEVVPPPTPPYILHQLTYSKNVPLQNLVYMNYSESYDVDEMWNTA